MSWESDKSEGLLYYCQPNKKFNSEKVLGLDLDWTVIKPEIGKKFPVSEDDWVFAYNLKKIKDYYRDGYKIVIFSNQKGSYEGKGGITFEEFQSRWFKILKGLGVPAYILAAPLDDFNRKPGTRMWDFMEDNLNGDIKVDRKKSLYVGDAAGRPKDHSDVDIKFAINLGVKFETPEEFFENSKEFPFEKLKDDLKGVNPKTFLEHLENNKDVNQASWKELNSGFKSDNLRVILLVGSPASGKSTLSKRLVEESVKANNRIWKVYSLDLEGTKKKLKDKIKKILLETEEGCIIDATNANKEARAEWIKLVESLNKDGEKDIVKEKPIKIWSVYSNISKELAFHLNKIRGIRGTIDPEYHSKQVPAVAIHAYWKKFTKPELNEGFEKIVEIDFEPQFKSKEEKKLFLTLL